MDNQSKFQFQFIYLARKKNYAQLFNIIITKMIVKINNVRNCIRGRIGDIFLAKKFKWNHGGFLHELPPLPK